MAETDVRSIETAEDLLGLDDLKIIPVSIQAWGGRIVHLREPSAAVALDLGRKVSDLKDDKDRSGDSLRLIVMALLVNSKGEQILVAPSHFEALNRKNARALIEIQTAGMKLLGWTNDETSEGKDASPETGPDSSPTA